MTESRAGWSDGDASDDVADTVCPQREASSISTPEGERYALHGTIGQGGMGTVFVALDRRLGREVALKSVSKATSSPKAQQRLAREAEITAWLEHPNIVPIYDAGIEREGEHFYTMRLVRGRSFREAINDSGECTDDRALRAMLRHYLAACQAVAFAHSRGVVHRDLTPSNIMVGAFGETQVVDWGLAAHTGSGELPVVGTPGYMSPDDVATARGDVWSLGAILKDVLAPTATSLDELRARAPTELFAVVRGCLSVDPAERFADAGALAKEIEHYLDGRRIASHEYSAGELLARAWKAWRAQIVATGLAVCAVVVVSAVAWRGLRAERDRATSAERETQAAFVERSGALRLALEQQAVSLLAEGDAPAAEEVALRAMRLGDSAALRGLLTDLLSRPRPQLGAWHALPECERFEPAGMDSVLCWGGATLSVFDVPTGERRWSVRSVATEVRGLPTAVAALDTSGVLTLRSIATDAVLTTQQGQSRFGGIQRDHAGTWIATASGRFVDFVSVRPPYAHRQVRLCGEELVAAVGLGHEWVAVACRSGRLLRARLSDWAFETVGTIPISSPSVPLVAIAVSGNDAWVAASNSNGEVVLLAADGTVLSTPTWVGRGLLELQFVGENVLAIPASGRPSLWDLRRRTKLMSFPGSVASYLRSERKIVSVDGTTHREWTLPDPLLAHTFRADVGLAAASESAEFVAGAGANGAVTLWNAQGEVDRTLPVGAGVVKRAAVSPGGRKLAVAHGGDEGLFVFDTDTWERQPTPRFPGGLRSLDWRGEELVVAPYRERVHFVRGHAVEAAGPPSVLDISVGANGDVATLAKDGTVWWCERGEHVFRRATSRPGATAVSTLGGGERVATVVGAKVELHDLATDATQGFGVRSGGVTDLVSTERGDLLFVSTVDGFIEVWSTASSGPLLIASWQAHRARISHLGVREGVLLSAGWDGLAKRWDLSALGVERGELERARADAWGP